MKSHGQIARIIDTYLNSNQELVTDPTKISQTKFEYDSNHGFVKSQTDPLGRRTEFTHNALGQMIQMIVRNTGDVGDLITNFRYDAYGNLFQVELVGKTYAQDASYLPSGSHPYAPVLEVQKRLTTFVYDTRNRLVARLDPDPGENLDANLETPILQDDVSTGIMGVLAADSRPRTAYRYDAYNQLREEIHALDESVNIAVTQFLYDELGRVERQINPAVSTVVGSALQSVATEVNYTYYAAGNLKSMTDAEGLQTQMVYDPWDRLLSQTYSRNNSILRVDQTQYNVENFDAEPEHSIIPTSGWATTQTITDWMTNNNGTLVSATK